MTIKKIIVLDERGIEDVIILEVKGEFEILKINDKKVGRVIID